MPTPTPAINPAGQALSHARFTDVKTGDLSAQVQAANRRQSETVKAALKLNLHVTNYTAHMLLVF